VGAGAGEGVGTGAGAGAGLPNPAVRDSGAWPSATAPEPPHADKAAEVEKGRV